ncbi:SOS response-associated peptidase [Paenibacillus mendelii]|uniref:Abasic site processing protein n=1 Tax=Paenibacillus mendelii TaxID=206163 RepID=A0ABV6JGM8_9BACL|nr:SOS response-associated peptidase family protein [Paenibacillus mendelii]MCQ6562513.1 SOS response-associated peptidase [Paenibacillus mendelii]
MCQAISSAADVSELTERYQIEKVLFHSTHSREINPTESVCAVFEHPYDGRLLDEFRWGLMPFWAKDSIWMESRTMLWKPIFDRILKRQRCVIPCTGFYVSRTEGKQTHRAKVSMRSGTFAIAGLYDIFRAPTGGEETRTLTLITTQANGLVSPYSRQMPAILEEEHVERWLKGSFDDPFEMHAMLKPMDAMRMLSVPIGSAPGDKVEFEVSRPEPIG